MPVGAGSNVDDGVAAEQHLSRRPDHVGEGQGGVREHAVAERSCCLQKQILALQTLSLCQESGCGDESRSQTLIRQECPVLSSSHGTGRRMEIGKETQLAHLDAEKFENHVPAPEGEVKTDSMELFFRRATLVAVRTYSMGSSCLARWNGRGLACSPACFPISRRCPCWTTSCLPMPTSTIQATSTKMESVLALAVSNDKKRSSTLVCCDQRGRGMEEKLTCICMPGVARKLTRTADRTVMLFLSL